MNLEQRLKQALENLTYKSSLTWRTEPRTLSVHHVKQFTEQLLPLLEAVAREPREIHR